MLESPDELLHLERSGLGLAERQGRRAAERHYGGPEPLPRTLRITFEQLDGLADDSGQPDKAIGSTTEIVFSGIVTANST